MTCCLPLLENPGLQAAHTPPAETPGNRGFAHLGVGKTLFWAGPVKAGLFVNLSLQGASKCLIRPTNEKPRLPAGFFTISGFERRSALTEETVHFQD